LSHLSQEQLSRLIFPIGHLHKNEVRKLAHDYDLPNKDRKDSQGICFLGKFKFSDFIKHHLGIQKGLMIESETGIVMGEHNGFWFYTIGQRQGLRLAGGPWYVVAKNSSKNEVYISRDYYAQEKQRDSFFVENVSWISGHAPKKQDLLVKLRHGQHLYSCKFTAVEGGRFFVQLAERDQGIAPGQYAAFYDGDICLGSGVIA